MARLADLLKRLRTIVGWQPASAGSRGNQAQIPAPKAYIVDGDVFVAASARADAETLRAAISKAFGIPAVNIFIDGEDTSNWSNSPASAFARSYPAGEIGWKLDLVLSEPMESPAAFSKLAEALGGPVFFDRRGKEYDDRVDAFVPERIEDGAEVRLDETEDDDLVGSIRWRDRPT